MVLHSYGRDLESVRKLYQKQCKEPTIARNLPPISGKIAWSRQLYRRIENPMKVFKSKPDIIKVSTTCSQVNIVIISNWDPKDAGQILLFVKLLNYLLSSVYQV